MPKSYSEQERQYIKRRLKEEAADCISQYGIRHTTVDELVKRVKIPKGTFYLFYQSKELLFLDVIQEQHQLIEKKLSEAVHSIDYNGNMIELLTEIAFCFFKSVSESPILGMLSSGEIEILERKLPPETLNKNLWQDGSVLNHILPLLPVKADIDVNMINAAFHAVYFSTLHKNEIGIKNFDEALRFLVKGLICQLF